MAFDPAKAKGHLKTLGYDEDSQEMNALLGFANLINEGGEQPPKMSFGDGAIATLGAGAIAGLSRLGGADHNSAVTQAMNPIQSLMKANQNAFSRGQEIQAELAKLAVGDRFSMLKDDRLRSRNREAADDFRRSIYGDPVANSRTVSAPIATRGALPPQAASTAAPEMIPGVDAPNPATEPPGAVGGSPGISVEPPVDPTGAVAMPSSGVPEVEAMAPEAAAAPQVSQFNQMMSSLRTPQARRHFQLAIDSISQQMASGNMKDGATLDAAYKAATDIDRQTIESTPEYQAEVAQKKKEGEERGKTEAEKAKAGENSRKVGEIMDALETIGSDSNVSGAIGPLEGQGWVQSIKGVLPGTSKSYDLNQKIRSATRNLELLVTRLTMQGQGQISEGERMIVRDAIGNLELSADAASYTDNVRYLRELVSGIFGREIPSKFGVESSMKERARLAIERARSESAAEDEKAPVTNRDAPTSLREGVTAVDQATGKKLVWKGGKWQDVKFNPRGAGVPQ